MGFALGIAGNGRVIRLRFGKHLHPVQSIVLHISLQRPTTWIILDGLLPAQTSSHGGDCRHLRWHGCVDAVSKNSRVARGIMETCLRGFVAVESVDFHDGIDCTGAYIEFVFLDSPSLTSTPLSQRDTVSRSLSVVETTGLPM